MNIKALFRDYNISYDPQSVNCSSPEFIQTQCVFCDDSSDHLGWHISGEFVNCWKCGGHSIEWALQKLLNLTRQQVIKLMKQYEGTGEVSARNRLNKKTPQAKEIKLPGGPLEKMHRKYLNS